MLLNLLGQNIGIIGRARYFFWERHHILTLRLGLIVLCLALTLASALLLPERGELVGTMPVLALVGLAGMLFVYYNFELTLLITLAVSMLLHDGVGTGTATKITFTFLLLSLTALLWIFKMVMVDRSVTLRRSPANLPGLLFMVVVVIAILWSDIFVDNPVRYIFSDKINPRIMSGLSLILSMLTFYLFANHIQSIRSMKFIVVCFVLVGTFFVMLNFGPRGVPEPFNRGGQFPAWVAALGLGQALFNKTWSRPLKILATVTSLTWMYVTYRLEVTWVSGWLPVALTIMVLVFFRSRRLFLFLAIVLVIVWSRNQETLNKTLNDENTESGYTRTDAWAAVLKLTSNHLLFGMGPAGYYMYYTVYGFPANLSHNNYLDILAQTGIVGFGVYIWFWVGVGWMALRTFRLAPRGGFLWGLSASLVASYAATVTVMMLGDWVTPFAYTQGLVGIDYTIWPWMLAGLTVALYHYLSQNPVVVAPSPTPQLAPEG